MRRLVLLCVGLGFLVGLGTWLRPSLSTPVAAQEAKAAKSDNLGYTAAFEAELKKIGQISPSDFSRRFLPRGEYLPRLTWDPTTAKFWDQIMMDPNAETSTLRLRGRMALVLDSFHRQEAERKGKPIPKGEPVRVPAKGQADFRLNEAELAAYTKNGFVVSERLGAKSCTDMYYRIYARDLPVFISSDSLLHAWHLSYDAMLEDIETNVLSRWLAEILYAMKAQVPLAKRDYGDGLMADSLVDADFFLAMALSLLSDAPQEGALGQAERIRMVFKHCQDEKPLRQYLLFRQRRDMDFSQFRPRGHYDRTDALKRYFRAMMWCGRIDLRVAGEPDRSSPHELAAAVVLNDLLRRAGMFERWQMFDRVLRGFVGRPDSMTFGGLGALLAGAGIRSPGDLKSEDDLKALQKKILRTNLGEQEIRGDWFCMDPYDPKKFVLPRSFTVIGQRFIPDSWVMSKIVFDDVLWDGKKVMRRIPSCLDAGFAVLGNDHLVPALTERMQNANGRKFRDGLNYQHNLAALRTIMDRQPAAAWQDNMYTGWLGSLRELSKPTNDGKYPEVMRTKAWAMKTANTQFASWTQLRHDTVLYAKQSYTGGVKCFYPAGYVEPVPHFWSALEQMARRSAAMLEDLPLPNQPKAKENHYSMFCKNFADTVRTLKGIAEKHLAQKELTKDETKFLENVVEIDRGCGGPPEYSGWYPRLLFNFVPEHANKYDALVTDVHSNTPALPFGDPGCIIHQGVGNIDLLIVAIDNGKDRMVFAGPTLSHYEFERPWGERMTDNEWRDALRAGKAPPRPEWTRGYFVPGINPGAKSYK